MRKKRLTEEQERLIRDNYPTRTSTDIAKEIGCPVYIVSGFAHRNGLKHSEQATEAIRKAQIAALSTPEAVAKRSATYRRMVRMERFRTMSGDRQKTQIRLAKLPYRSYARASYLRRKYNYFSDESGKHPDVLYYDGETRRTPNEDYYTRRYGIRFMEGGEQ